MSLFAPGIFEDVVHFASPNALMQIFPLIIKNFQKTWLLIFLARIRVWCLINLDPFVWNEISFFLHNTVLLRDIAQSWHICNAYPPFPIPTALNSGTVHTDKVKAICQFRIRALSAVQKKPILLHPHHNLLWEWQPWRRLTMWLRPLEQRAKWARTVLDDALPWLHARGWEGLASWVIDYETCLWEPM